MSTQETWYVLDDGRAVDPNEVAPNESGALVHSSGVAVAMRAHGVPRSRGVDPAQERAKAAAAAAGAKTQAKPGADEADKSKGDPTKDMKPEEGKQGYKTREAKGE